MTKPIILPPSNRLSFVDREDLFGTISGVDFGANLSCIARSPTAALLWSGGTAYWSGRGTSCYGQSCLYALDRARIIHGVSGGTRRLGDKDGGRLTVARLTAVIGAIETLFDVTDLLPWLAHAVANKQTLLIDGGGQRFAPSRRLGHDAYVQWTREIEAG
jgi:hypothetical protein